jgi:glycosyltransferase involved in cell wall biosynthesis
VSKTLRILHVMRTPVGGLFRHVLDLATEQVNRGHAVGIVADSSTGGNTAAQRLDEIATILELGVSRVPMSRQVGLQDRAALLHVEARARETRADVLHGHGAKGGAYARLADAPALKVYTPHGGSLHYSQNSPLGFAYLAIERWLRQRTDLVLFESRFSEETFRKKIGAPRFARVVHNGVTQDDLRPVFPDGDAADFIYLGEMRRLKGVGTLLEAFARLSADGWNGTAILYGDGPDRRDFEAQADRLGLLHQVHFPGASPAREAFSTGRVLAVPSWAESLPYIVLEAAAASVPVVATNVGGIPEIFGPDAGDLIAPRDVAALAGALDRACAEDATAERTERLRERIASSFTVERMADGVLEAYAAAQAARSGVPG